MIIFDTNVVSELMRAEPNPHVNAWAAGLPMSSVYTTTITQAEIFYGVYRMADGKRKQILQASAEKLFVHKFEGRMLVFDAKAALKWAAIKVESLRRGWSIGVEDMQIAAIALAANATVATRNVLDFERSGVAFINPWTA